MRRLLALCLAVLPALALAQEDREAVLSGLLEQRDIAPDRLAPAFRAEVPPAALTWVLDDVVAQVGTVEDITLDGSRFTITGTQAVVRGTIALDDEGRIATLFFEPPEPVAETIDDVTEGLTELGADVAWLVTRGDETLAAHRADDVLSVASAYKLGVLAALRAEVESGARDWADVVRLQDRHRSLPSGAMQDWPEGAPVTLQTAATLMIAESDNTATDLLIDTLGREAVAEALGQDGVLTTREIFALRADPDAAAAWRAADPEEAARIAAEAARDLPDLAAIGDEGPDWQLSARALCELMEQVGDLDILSVNPGPVPPDDWAQIAYKGGELGDAYNLTALVSDGRAPVCAALTVNGRTAPPAEIVGAFRALLAAAREAGE